MSSSPVCTCCVCPAHGPAGHGADHPGGGAGWAGPVRRYLESVVEWLDGPEAMGAGHGVLEARLQVHSREQYRLLLQGHLDERARLEKRRSAVTGSDGVSRPRVENGHRRGLTTVFGPVAVTRKAYRAVPGAAADTGAAADASTACPTASGALPGPASDLMPEGTGTTTGTTTGTATGTAPEAPVPQASASATSTRNLHPADAVLNLPVGRHSAGLQRLAAVEAPRGSFADAREAIERATGVRLGKRQVEELARTAAVDTEAFYAARRRLPRPDRVLGLQADGKGIVMRPGSLRPGTAARAAQATAKLATRLSPGEKHGRKRMAEIVAVYDLDPAPRTVADIIPTRRRSQQDGSQQNKPAHRPGPVVTGKWLTANVTDDIPAVIAAMFDEAERRDPAHERTWVALVDGNRQQIDTIRDQATARGVTVTVVIDFVHVLEYLWKAAWTFFYPGDWDAETWVADRARTILTGRAVDAAATIRHQADEAGFRDSERTGADEAAAYLTRKAPYLNYATALASGWQIATGIIEGAARFLIKDRMDITGARWSTPGAEAVLRLRAVIANGDFDEYWQWHQQQELRRNHLDRYQELDLAA
jgi:hypothetical protein